MQRFLLLVLLSSTSIYGMMVPVKALAKTAGQVGRSLGTQLLADLVVRKGVMPATEFAVRSWCLWKQPISYGVSAATQNAYPVYTPEANAIMFHIQSLWQKKRMKKEQKRAARERQILLAQIDILKGLTGKNKKELEEALESTLHLGESRLDQLKTRLGFGKKIVFDRKPYEIPHEIDWEQGAKIAVGAGLLAGSHYLAYKKGQKSDEGTQKDDKVEKVENKDIEVVPSEELAAQIKLLKLINDYNEKVAIIDKASIKKAEPNA